MRGALALAAHSFRRTRALILGAGLVFGAFQVLSALMASTFQESQLFSRIAEIVPPYVRQALGSSFLSIMSFTGIAVLGYMHFAVMGSLVGLAIAIATEPASEIERGFSDLLMTRPVPRATAITRSVLLLVLTATVTNVMMLAGTWSGLALFAHEADRWPTPQMLLSLAASLWMLMWCWGGIALAFGAASRRRSVAGGVAGFVAVTLFLADVVARVWERGRSLGPFSPFHYFNPAEIVSGRPLNGAHMTVLAALGALGIAAAYLIYRRRDL
jgi:ABC-type transport system involved in multi-copper enzyme maturation permease subunit